MSPSARRLSGVVNTSRFRWQSGSAEGALRPTPVLFAQSASTGAGDPLPEVEARELHLPVVTTEHVQAIEREAFARGYASGEAAAERDAAVRLSASLTRLDATIAEVAAIRPAFMRRTERELVRLSISMAERIVRRELAVDPDLLLVMARVVIDRLGEQAAATVHLNPADVAALSPRTDAVASLAVASDASVERGGCVIRSAVGIVDVGITSQLAELARELLGGDTSEENADGVVADV